MNKPWLDRFQYSTTVRLAASYLAIIMVLSIGFSYVLYKTSARELGRQIPPSSMFAPDQGSFGEPGTDYHSFFQERIEEGQSHLFGRLVFLNLFVLVTGAGLSYYLARRTLEPMEAAVEAQSRFVTDASHELRTPLTAILASNEVALRKPHMTLAQAKDVIKSNTEEMVKLKNLSDGLLSLSKQNTRLAVRQPVSLQDVAGEAMNRVLAAAQAKHIAIQDDTAAFKVSGDLQGLVQVAAILLDNAVKYSPDKSTVYLETREQDGYGCLSVRDQGPGISPKDLPRIFDRFYRADQARSSSETGGHGIGLAIARTVVEQHQGRIIVNSTLGEGSTFIIQIPLGQGL